MKRWVICISGDLGFTTLQQLAERGVKPVYVFTDKKSIQTIDYCKGKEIPFFAGNPRGKDWSMVKKNVLCDILLSVNYLYILDETLLSWAEEQNLNIHGSLLPKYRGRTPHVWAIINGESETGITVHQMEKEVDAGKILLQEKFSIDENTTGADILGMFKMIYPNLVNKIIDCVEKEEWNFWEQDEDKATYFGKRTPEDGKIDWNWCKERIRNWIRAQAHPYPGAFFYYNEERIVVNKACCNDKGFTYDDENGKILEVGKAHITVKTSNGALKLEELSITDFNIFNVGGRLS